MDANQLLPSVAFVLPWVGDPDCFLNGKTLDIVMSNSTDGFG
ncbi:hypothetical protein [Candidatus Methylacidiphilum fumarolicum]|nr:hypothetical protein [Candidatus Methylacidiphilum fumarolicum]